MTRALAGALELWGGPECTVNRVGDLYRDQLVETGHHNRLGDLKRFAELGLTSLRYPILWERVSGEVSGRYDWKWSDSRLAEIGRLGMRPIAGLLHHGSGPRYTQLGAENFVEEFSSYALAVAQRYPWITDWTPINEPLTTARFSALYGFWYPHARDEGVFWRLFLNQIDGIRGAMRAIRTVIPGARLIQTEDLGETVSTVTLLDEAGYFNHRRWLTWDLLTGRVTPGHLLWERIVDVGLAPRLLAIAGDPCPPDIIGVNHYLTSNRFLDDRITSHPTLLPGRHVDLEAVRHHRANPSLDVILRQAWERYGLPLAVTESHNGCTRDEQMRWTHDAWQTSLQLRATGVDVRAITAWSLVGSCDWSSLLTSKGGVYEVGAFEVGRGTIRETAMTDMLRGLAAGSSADVEPRRTILSTPGWWKRAVRFGPHPYGTAPVEDPALVGGACVLITGLTGTLGSAFAGACALRGLPWQATRRDQLDIGQPTQIGAVLDKVRPWAVINAAGWSRIDAAEDDPTLCFDVNSVAATAMALACAQRDIPCVTFSSHQVFNGRSNRAYREGDRPDPLSVYGRSKVHAEQGAYRAGGRQLIIRSATFFSPFGPPNLATRVAQTLRAGLRVRAAKDCVMSATYVPDLVNAVIDLLIDGETGLWHLTSGTELSWADFAYQVADGLGLDRELVTPMAREDMAWRAERPAFSALRSDRAIHLPGFSYAMARFVAEFSRK